MKWTFKSGSTRTRIVLAFHAALLDVSLARVEITPAGYCWTRQRSMSFGLVMEKWVYFSSDRGGIWAIWKVAPEGGSAVQVTPQGERGALDESFVYGWSESVDRKFLYYVQNNSLWRVDATGGEAFRILAFAPVRWRLFRNGICFMDDSTRPAQLKLLDLSRAKTTRFGTVDLGPPAGDTGLGFDVSPDGQWVLY